jgi:hypothetical protein
MGNIHPGIANVPLLVCDPRTMRHFGSAVRMLFEMEARVADVVQETSLLSCRPGMPNILSAGCDCG